MSVKTVLPIPTKNAQVASTKAEKKALRSSLKPIRPKK